MRWVVVLVLVTAVACGGDDDTSDRNTAPPTSARGTGPTAAAVHDRRCREGSASSDGIALDDVTEQLGLVDPLRGLVGHATATADVNSDGWLDLFVGTFTDKKPETYQQRGASGPAPDRLLLGGPKGFRPDASFKDGKGRTTGALFADLDGDGDLDLVVARNVTKRSPAGEDTVVLRNDSGRFQEAIRPVPGLGARGIAALDHDGDGDLDLFVAEDHYQGGSSVLLRNDGGFRFADITPESGLPDDVAGFSAVAADLTDDGRADLFVAGSNRLFVNDGKGRFREADGSVFHWDTYGDEDDVTGVAVGDLNRDGRPDLVLGQHYNSTLDFNKRVPIRIYLQQGVGKGEPVYRDVTAQSGVPALPTKGPHVEIADFDDDGWPDILVSASAGGGSRPALLRHLGLRGDVPHFSGADGLGDPQYWVTGATGDFDGDGHLDVFLVENDPAKPSRLWRGATCTGHWLEVDVGPDPANAGAQVAAYRPGRAGKPAGLLGAQPVVAERGYAAGGPPTVRFGLGDAERVDVVVTPLGEKARTASSVEVDRVLHYPRDFGG